jgi:V/A-type H+-transporting ATPase subunit K
MTDLISIYFVKSGIGWAMLGAGAALMLGCAGSARGIRIAAGQAAGVMSEKPELFGKLLPLMAMPGTQGIYGLLWVVIVAMRTGLFGKEPATVTPLVGIVFMLLGIAVGGALLKSAVLQGETSAASINLTARRPDQGGRSIILPALVEFYALVALVAGIMVAFLVNPAKLGEASPEKAGAETVNTAPENPGGN